MALPYVYVTRRDLARGIDTHSPKTALPDGYAEDLQNFDTNSSGKLETRKGYEGVYGWLPFRVEAAEHSGTQILLTLPAGVDVTSKAKSALVVSGRLSTATSGDTPAGDFTTTAATHWYPTWDIFSQLSLIAPTGTVTVEGAVHGRTTTQFWPVLFEGTPGVSATPIQIDATAINTTTYDVDFTYTVPANAQVYAQYSDVVTAAGSVYHRSVTQTAAAAVTFSGATCSAAAHGLAVDDVVVFATDGALPAELTAGQLYRVASVPTGSTFTVSTLTASATVTTTTAGTGSHTWERRGWATTSGLHGLNTQEILVKCWDTTISGTAVTEVKPAGYYVTTGGTVTVYFEADFTGTLSMVSVPANQYDTQTSVAGSNTYTGMSIDDANYAYVQALVYNSTMSRYDAVDVDSYTVDPAAHTYTLTLTAPGAETYKLCWLEASLAGNVIAVTDSGAVSENWTDGIPQLTVWGLGHADAYSSDTQREGHVNHLDVYRRAGEATLVAGLGGNLMAGTDAPAANDAYGTQSVACKFVPSTSAAVVTGRYFYASAPSPTPNDYAVDATYINSSGGWLCNTVTYSAATHSWVLRLPKSGGFSTSGLSNLKWVDLAGFPHAVLNGTFRVTGVDSQASYLDLRIGVPAALTQTDTELARYDLTVATGRVSCPYGRIPVTGLAAWDRPAAGDTLTVEGLTTDWTVMGVLTIGADVYYSGAGTPLTIPAGTAVGVTRTAPTLMLEDLDGNLTAEGYVPGDMVSVTGLTNTPRVLWVFDALAADSVAITAWTTPDTVTWPTDNLPGVGTSVWLYAAGTIQVAGSSGSHTYDYDASGYYTVESVNLTTSAVTFTEDFVPSGATLYNSGADWVMSVPYGQVCLDESLEHAEAGSDRTQVSVTGRWVPIEAPTPGTSDLGKATWQYHLDANDYLAQPPLHSTTLNDALFATQGDDPVMKYDGTNLYRAGMPRWPLTVFARVLTGGSGSVAPGPTFAVSAVSSTGKSITAAYAPVKVGDRLYDSSKLTTPVTVTSVTSDSSSNTVLIVRSTDSLGTLAAADTPTIVAQYRYYTRLTAVDANGYLTTSAATGWVTVDVVATCAVQLQLQPPPAFGALDWGRMELEVYRTKADDPSTYYRIHREVLDWDPAKPYIYFTDGLADLSLVTQDSTMQFLAASRQGASGTPEVLTQLEGPPRGTVVTTLDNRLVLGNITGWPEAKLNFLPAVGSSTITKANLAGGRILVRRDSADTGTATSMNSRVGYEFVSPESLTFTFDSAADLDDTTETITKAAHGMVTGQAFRLTGTLPTGLSLATTYYAIVASSSTFKVASTAALAHAGTAINLTDNAGTATLTGYDGIGIDPTAITATTSTFVVSSDAHGLTAGDWVYLFHSDLTATTKSLRWAGWWRVASVTTDTFTISLTQSAVNGTTADVDRWCKATTTTDVPVWLGPDGNWLQQDGIPSTDSWQLQAPRRLAAAVNASMRAATTSAYSTTFTPWLVAYAGTDQALGECVLRLPNAEATTPEVKTPSSLSGYRLYVNDVAQAASTEVAFETGVWPSRLVRSFRNYPEIFDAPFVADASDSDAVIDVNPADGQEIVAVLPMFGESAGGAASQLSQTLLVFKTASVYLVNVDTRTVERLNTRGQGCTAPRSVALTQEGVAFANASGVFRINRDYTMTTLGLRLKGLWRDSVNSDAIAEACATHWAEGRRYKLAVPTGTSDYADQVLVYDYDRELDNPDRLGAWTRYTNHTPVWWANDGADAYWASQVGDVFRLRRAGAVTDYRDDGAAVAEQIALLRAEDFDLPGVRKAVKYVTTLVELDTTPLTSLVVKSAPNLTTDYTEGGRVSYTLAEGRHQTFRTPPASRRATHIQMRYSHGTIDEACVLAGVQFEVAQLSSKAVQDSGDA